MSPHSIPVARHADDAVRAELREIGERTVSCFTIAGGKRHGAIGLRGGETAALAVRSGAQRGVPVVGFIDSGGADITEGVSALHGWGLIARELARASGVVPTLLAVNGACVSGPALLLGLVDAVVMTTDAFAYVSGPPAVADFTGIPVTRRELGGAPMHAVASGLAALVVDDELGLDSAIETLLSYLPPNHLEDPPLEAWNDVVDRDCLRANDIVPLTPTEPYDIRDVIADIVDADSFFELRPDHASNLVTGFARVDGRSVGVIANQPLRRAGTIDIEASRKAARFVGVCDAFNVPLLTLVDTPGYEPGRDLEWRGMIRHGAQLVHAYCEATVPRVCVILRKAYGGGYIVMDSRGIGNDACFAWPSAEIAVMGAAGASQILGDKLTTAADYERAFLNPWRAAERGFVDDVIDPRDTRRTIAAAFATLATKRDSGRQRKHSNGPM